MLANVKTRISGYRAVKAKPFLPNNMALIELNRYGTQYVIRNRLLPFRTGLGRNLKSLKLVSGMRNIQRAGKDSGDQDCNEDGIGNQHWILPHPWFSRLTSHTYKVPQRSDHLCGPANESRSSPEESCPRVEKAYSQTVIKKT